MTGLLPYHLPLFMTGSQAHTAHGEVKQAAIQTWDKEQGKVTSAEGLDGVGQTTCHRYDIYLSDGTQHTSVASL